MKAVLGSLCLWAISSLWGLTLDAADPRTRSAKALWSIQPFQTSLREAPLASQWDRNQVDSFIRGKLEQIGVIPQKQAEDRILLRRLYLDLLGLLPSPEETNEYLFDASPHRYARKVEELLASPAYGERWARHWLDVVRFAESSGFEHDSDRPHAYPYRDFVIQAFNLNLPFNTFLEWQLAGDQLLAENPLAKAATGFLGAGVFPTQLTEKEFESARYDELDDMVSTTGTAMLALSIGCARCHDHKFDPIPTEDYYRLAATFTKTIRTEVELTSDLGQNMTAMISTDGGKPMKHAADGRGYPHFFPSTFILKRGDVNKKGKKAEPGFLSMLKHESNTSHLTAGSRSQLAKWITDPDRGGGRLAARVIVNRLWQHHFGTGLVSTPNDFGTQGSKPTHPRLLDWLAKELIQRGWNLKSIQRTIVTSATYRQSSHPVPETRKKDPDNTLLWRFPARRLEAEAIRDSMLGASGMLDSTPFGPGSLDPNMPRRSIYFFVKRSQLTPFLLLFDFPEPMVSIGKRASTSIAPQGLTLMNSPTIRMYAKRLVARARSEVASGQAGEIIQRIYNLTYNRPATPTELTRCQQFLEQQAKSSETTPHEAFHDLAHGLLMSNEFLYQR